MARKFLIATHGALAQGVKSSLDIIIGPMDNIVLVEAYLEGAAPVEETIGRLLGEGGEWVVFSDLLGGSVTNKLVQGAVGRNVHIIAGFNLSLVIEIILADPETPVVEVVERAIRGAREQLVYVNELITLTNNKNA